MMDFARQVGVDHSYISRLESGKRDPGREVVDLIVEAFPDLSAGDIEWLYFYAGYVPTSEWDPR
jgi:predicted transcriptional regulator